MSCPTIATNGSCTLTRCDATDSSSASSNVLSAGTVSATSTPVALQVVAAPDLLKGGGYPHVQQSLMGDFKGGEVVTFAATGADAPPFSKELKMFAPLVLTKPSSPETSIPIPYRGVELEWQPGEAGSSVTVSAFGSGDAWTQLLCTWDATAGVGSVPAEALKPLPNGTELNIGVRRDTVYNAGNFAITLVLVSGVRNVKDSGGRQLVLDDSL
jgi:hypothetical protein